MNLKNQASAGDKTGSDLHKAPRVNIDQCQANEEAPELGLRKRAEAIFRDHAEAFPESNQTPTLEAAQITLHELRVHQIELEMQNEELRRTQLELDATRTRYFDLYDLAPVGYCTLSEAGLITEANLTASALFGDLRRSLINQPLSSFIVKEDQDLYYLARKRLLIPPSLDSEYIRNAQDFELRIIKKDGTQFWAHLKLIAVKGADKNSLFRLTLNDISERKQAELEKAHVEAQFQQAQKMESIGQLAGGIAHDFNNMLAGTMLQLGLLEKKPNLDSSDRLAIKELKEGAFRAANLTRQLLMYSRRAMISLKPVDLDQVVQNLLKMLRRVIGENYQLAFIWNGNISQVLADIGMMEQVLMNLVLNARDAMPTGGLIQMQCYDFTGTEETCAKHPKRKVGQFVCLEVSDTGCGIPPENLQSIFDPFFTTKEIGKGTGLGLASVDGIVHQHNGWIEVESDLGRGSMFRVYLPAIEYAASYVDTQSTEPLPIQRGSETILLVEDDESLCAITRLSLAGLGYRIVIAHTPSQALALWEREGTSVDLLLTDMRMPERMTGLELMRRLRETRPQLPAIIMSGYSADLSREGGITEPNCEFLQKPFDITELTASIRRNLSRR